MGRAGEAEDVALVRAAREGLGDGGPDGSEPRLMVDAGVAWGEDAATAYARAVAFAPYHLTWLEEPLSPDAVEAYAALAARRPPVPIAAGEGSGTYRAAEDLALHGGVRFLQIDAGRIGGITIAHRVRQLAAARGLHYVNHTFKSHISLAAAIHVFAAVEGFDLLEYPAGGSDLATRLTESRLEPGPDGLVRAPEAPGLGVRLDISCVREYLQQVKIELGGEVLYRTPSVDG
jgi:L-alanine-DL-glutamate epimerase-like enolase superfamily enzyme